jgi:hypothetical protein
MDKKTASYIKDLNTNPRATSSLIREIESKLGLSFPDDYKNFMMEFNGAEGPIGSQSYLMLWRIEELEDLNKVAAVDEFAPGLLLFGSDGGGMSYAFDTRKTNTLIVEVPTEILSIDKVKQCGQTFQEFLEYLYYQS